MTDLLAKAGFLNTTTQAAGNTVAVTGLWGENTAPKVVFFFWNGRTNTTDSVSRASHQSGFGAAVSASKRFYTACLALDTPTSMETNSAQANTACIGITTSSDSLDGLMDLQTMDSASGGGFTLVIDNAFNNSYTIMYLALAGDLIGDVDIQAFTKRNGAGTQDVEQVAFLPNFLLMASTGQTTNNDTVLADSQLAIGVAKSSSNQYCIVGGGNDAAGNAQTVRSLSNGSVFALLNATTINIEDDGQFVNFHSSPANGFQLNWVNSSATAKIINYVAFRFTDPAAVVLGDLLTLTDTTTDIVESGLGHTPAGGMLFSHCGAVNSLLDDHELSIGAFNSTTSRLAMALMDDDANATARVGTAVEFDNVYANLPNTAASVEGLMDVTAIASGSLTFRMTDEDPAQAFVFYVSFGSIPAVTDDLATKQVLIPELTNAPGMIQISGG